MTRIDSKIWRILSRRKLHERVEVINDRLALLDGKYYYAGKVKAGKARLKGKSVHVPVRGFAHFLDLFTDSANHLDAKFSGKVVFRLKLHKPIGFGRFKHLTVKEIEEENPSYLDWIYEKTEKNLPLGIERRIINQKLNE